MTNITNLTPFTVIDLDNGRGRGFCLDRRKSKVEPYLRRLICLALLLAVLPSQGNAQTPEDFFPHQLDDMWEYYLLWWGIQDPDTLKVAVVLDSSAGNGVSYVSHLRRFLDVDPLPLFPSYEHFAIDTFALVTVWQGYGNGNSVYNLDANVSERWIVDDLGGGCYNMARVLVIYQDTIFGVPTTVKRLKYFVTCDTTDTTLELTQYLEELAEGFGTIYRGGGDLGYTLYLKAARIGGTIYGDTTVVSVAESRWFTIPDRAELFQNYPNPFNPSTTVAFELPRSSHVLVEVFNPLGQRIAMLVDETKSPGRHSVVFNAEGLPSGVYFVRLAAEKQILSRALLLLR